MSNLVELKDSQLKRLQSISIEKGVAPNILLENALDLLFQQTDRERICDEELAFLRQLESETDLASLTKTRLPFKKEEIEITQAILMDPVDLHRR